MNFRSIIGLTAITPFIIGSVLSLSTTACAPKSRFRGPVTLNTGGDKGTVGALSEADKAKLAEAERQRRAVAIQQVQEEISAATATPETAAASTQLSGSISVLDLDVTAGADGLSVNTLLQKKVSDESVVNFSASAKILKPVPTALAIGLSDDATDAEKEALKGLNAAISCNTPDCSAEIKLTVKQNQGTVILVLTHNKASKLNATSDAKDLEIVKALNDKKITVKLIGVADNFAKVSYNIIQLKEANGKITMLKGSQENGEALEVLNVEGSSLEIENAVVLNNNRDENILVLQLTVKGQVVTLVLGSDQPVTKETPAKEETSEPTQLQTVVPEPTLPEPAPVPSEPIAPSTGSTAGFSTGISNIKVEDLDKERSLGFHVDAQNLDKPQSFNLGLSKSAAAAPKKLEFGAVPVTTSASPIIAQPIAPTPGQLNLGIKGKTIEQIEKPQTQSLGLNNTIPLSLVDAPPALPVVTQPPKALEPILVTTEVTAPKIAPAPVDEATPEGSSAAGSAPAVENPAPALTTEEREQIRRAYPPARVIKKKGQIEQDAVARK